jgi:hypothetical protein
MIIGLALSPMTDAQTSPWAISFETFKDSACTQRTGVWDLVPVGRCTYIRQNSDFSFPKAYNAILTTEYNSSIMYARYVDWESFERNWCTVDKNTKLRVNFTTPMGQCYDGDNSARNADYRYFKMKATASIISIIASSAWLTMMVVLLL